VTVFVDTNVLIYAMTNTAYSEPCRRVLTAVATGTLDATTSVLVAEEAWHVERRSPLRIPPGSILTLIGFFDRVLGCDVEILEDAMRMMVPDNLGSADRIHIATCRAHGIDTIVSADSAFDAINWLRRFEPDPEGVNAILAGR
jgi:predicted nucleic acid-binding protein